MTKKSDVGEGNRLDFPFLRSDGFGTIHAYSIKWAQLGKELSNHKSQQVT